MKNKDKTLLVSILSDQTIPNLQLIKEYKEENTSFLFISSSKMEKIGVGDWIAKAAHLDQSRVDTLIVAEHSYVDVQKLLEEKFEEFKSYNRILVNVTGGTKMMSLAVANFFKDKNLTQEIFYLNGVSGDYIKVFKEGGKEIKLTFTQELNLEEYLFAYGFKIKKDTKTVRHSFEENKKLHTNFNTLKWTDVKTIDAMAFLRNRRGKKIEEIDYFKVAPILDALEYSPQNENSLTANETKYLTGDWFEEYVAHAVKESFDLDSDSILIGAKIEKTPKLKVRNNAKQLLKEDGEKEDKGVSENELDVMFIYKNQIYVIECKSSILDFLEQTLENEADALIANKKYKRRNILGETLYKSDSLKNNFGLFANFNIVTMTSFSSYWKDEWESAKNKKDQQSRKDNKLRALKDLIARADFSNIRLVDGDMLAESTDFKELLKN